MKGPQFIVLDMVLQKIPKTKLMAGNEYYLQKTHLRSTYSRKTISKDT